MASNLNNTIKRLYPPSPDRWELQLKNMCSRNDKLMEEIMKDRDSLERIQTKVESLEKTSTIGSVIQQQSQTILEEVRSLRQYQRQQDATIEGLVMYTQNQQQQIDTMNGLINSLKDHLTLAKISASEGFLPAGPAATLTSEVNAAPRKDGQENIRTNASGDSKESTLDELQAQVPPVTVTNPGPTPQNGQSDANLPAPPDYATVGDGVYYRVVMGAPVVMAAGGDQPIQSMVTTNGANQPAPSVSFFTSTPSDHRQIRFPDMPSPMPPRSQYPAACSDMSSLNIGRQPPQMNQDPSDSPQGDTNVHQSSLGDTNVHPSLLDKTGATAEVPPATDDVRQEVFSGVATVYQGPTDQDSAEFQEGLACNVYIQRLNNGAYQFLAVDVSTQHTVAESILQPGMEMYHECDNTVLRWNNQGNGIALEFEDQSVESYFEEKFRGICK